MTSLLKNVQNLNERLKQNWFYNIMGPLNFPTVKTEKL